MPKNLMQSVVGQLQTERVRLANELRRVTAALTAFGKVYVNSGKPKAITGNSNTAPTRKRRTISAAGRKRIAAAQKARWAKIRAGKKH